MAVAGRDGRAARLVAVNLLVFAGLVVGVEGCVRVAHPEIRPLGTDGDLLADRVFGDVPGPRPGASGTSNGAVFRVDERGFWSYGDPPDTSAPGWLFLGDSVTMGVGVSAGDTFAGIVDGGISSYHALNPSVVGYASDDYLTILTTLLSSPRYADLNIRRVSIFWCLNDIYGVLPQGAVPDEAVRRALSPILGFIQRNVYTYQWLKAVLFDRPRRYFEHDVRFYTAENLAAAAAQMNAAADLCSAHGVACDLVLLPYEYQLRAAGVDSIFRPQRMLGTMLDRPSFRVHDLSDVFLSRGGDTSELFLYGDGIHLSAAGHRLVADYLMDLL